MRFIKVFFISWLTGYAVLVMMPWWISILLSFFLVLCIPLNRKAHAFLAPALGNLGCWLSLIILRDLQNGHLLSERIATLFHLPSYMAIIMISGFIGFITAGLGGWTAATLQDLLKGAVSYTKRETE